MGTFIVRDVRIFDGVQEIPNGSVFVQNGKIKAVSPSAIDPPYESTPVFSKPGHTLLPGLIDGHVHAEQPAALTQSLKFGVTTICDLASLTPDGGLNLRKQALEPDTADAKTTHYGATVENGWPAAVITWHDKSPEMAALIAGMPRLRTEADVDAYIADQVIKKPDYIKLFQESGASMTVRPTPMPIELQKYVIRRAHEHGFLTLAHATCLADTLAVLNAGTDGLTHTFVDQPPTKELIDTYIRTGAHCNPTLAVLGSLTAEGQAEQERWAHDPRAAAHLPEEFRQGMCKCMRMGAETASVEYAYETVRQLHKAGVPIVCGTDATATAYGVAWGLSVHHELALLVARCGMTAAEALRTATSVAADRLRFPDRGRVAPGLKADLVLVHGDPTRDIDATLNLRAVWRDGVLCSTYKGFA